jgi:hypothetical protein
MLDRRRSWFAITCFFDTKLRGEAEIQNFLAATSAFKSLYHGRDCPLLEESRESLLLWRQRLDAK